MRSLGVNEKKTRKIKNLWFIINLKIDILKQILRVSKSNNISRNIWTKETMILLLKIFFLLN